jgi:hypothetical protein
MRKILLFVSLAAICCACHGCDEKDSLTLLFTSDVKGELTPVG